MRLKERALLLFVRAAREVKNHGLSPGGRLYLLGRMLDGAGFLSGAGWAYRTSLRAAKRGDHRSVFRVLQWRQFYLERLNRRRGRPHATDPLLEGEIVPVTSGERASDRALAGFYGVEWAYSGLRVDFMLTTGGRDRVQLVLDGHPLRTMAPKKFPLLPPFFSLTIKRPALRSFPNRLVLGLRTEDGRPLAAEGARRVRVYLPHGDGTIKAALGNGAVIDKKGYPVESEAEVALKHRRFLEIYDRAREVFDEVVGTPLFLMYGTLLGYVRQRDYIPGDDDFDVGYFSQATTTDAVREEAKDIVVRLVQAGLTVSFNRFGRLFRLRLSGEAPDLHLDVRPLWYERGKVWAHKQACLSLTPDDFVPVEKGTFRDTSVYVPRKAEAFLAAYYGPSWRVPDPGYSNDSVRIPARVMRHLDRTCVTPKDLREMERRIGEGRMDGRGLGRLISIGSHSLYPLEDYERYCEWSV